MSMFGLHIGPVLRAAVVNAMGVRAGKVPLSIACISSMTSRRTSNWRAKNPHALTS